MCLPAPSDVFSALLDNKDLAPSVTQNGFSAVDCLIFYFLEGGAFSGRSASPFIIDVGLDGVAALWLDSQEDALSPVNFVIG